MPGHRMRHEAIRQLGDRITGLFAKGYPHSQVSTSTRKAHQFEQSPDSYTISKSSCISKRDLRPETRTPCKPHAACHWAVC